MRVITLAGCIEQAYNFPLFTDKRDIARITAVYQKGGHLMPVSHKPEILAPAGSRDSFLAALAAGADAVYCGLKRFSARMQADNFDTGELCRLVDLAHAKNIRVFVALNTVLKQNEVDEAGRLLAALAREVKPDALIIQDVGFVPLARQAGFTKEIHLSTLSCVTFSAALSLARKSLGVDRVVLPREFGIDEIKQAAAACPPGLGLETFVHGALCYGVSGRCYWSSYLGGKSGLRGNCVQPCRRIYRQGRASGRYFSCLDFSLDVLVKTLLPIDRVTAWKIEGRKKGAHYVYYTTTAYKVLRDCGNDPSARKNAMGYLEQALGRKTTHYNFLPQRPYPPSGQKGETGSGLYVGKIRGQGGARSVSPRMDLLDGDLLRIGYEDRPGHGLCRVTRFVPSGGRFVLKIRGAKPVPGSPVFLIDRMEKELRDIILELERELAAIPARPTISPSALKAIRKKKRGRCPATRDMSVYRVLPKGRAGNGIGLWLSLNMVKGLPKKAVYDTWFWLPPVVWQDDEDNWKRQIGRVISMGARKFVLNAPWQMAFFKHVTGIELWAGPFCNQANVESIGMLADMGFSGVIASPELSLDDYLALPAASPLPLGVVLSGNWPLCVARTIPPGVKQQVPFQSPRGERAWAVWHDSLVWLYPDWIVDAKARKKIFSDSGFSLFVHLIEPLPKGISLKKRPGNWNLDSGLL